MNQQNLYSTRTAAKKLGVKTEWLSRQVWLDRVEPPAKSPAGAFLWTDSDIERASWQLLNKGLDNGSETD